MHSNNTKEVIGRFLSELFNSLKDNNVTYCILGDYEGLPYEPGNDVDVWVKESDHARFQKTLSEKAEKLAWKIIKPNISPRLSFGVEGKYYLVRNAPPFAIIHMDIWTFLHWRGVTFIDEEVIARNTYSHEKGFLIPSKSITAGISLLKDLLYKKKVLDRRKEKLTEFFDSECVSFLEAMRKPFGKELSKLTVDRAKAGKWGDLEMAAYSFRKVLLKKAFLYNPLTQMKHWKAYFFGVLKNMIFTKYGLFLVVMGPDGSGKTTLLKELLGSELLDKLFERKFYFHTKFPFFPPLRKIACSLGLIDKNKLSYAEEPPREMKSLPVWKSMIYPLYYGISTLLGHFWIWKQKKNGGSLIVFDRYFYEYLVQNEFSRCPRWFLYFITRVIPEADLLIFLKNDAENIARRKQELSVEEIERQLNEYREVAGSFPNSLTVSTHDLHDTVERIKEIMIERLAENN